MRSVQMVDETRDGAHPRRFRVQSLKGRTDEVTEAAQLLLYVQEVGKQADIASRLFYRAWHRALERDTRQTTWKFGAIFRDCSSPIS